MFHIRHKAVAGQKIPGERIRGGKRALDDSSARQAYQMDVVGVIGKVIGRRAVVEVGVGDLAHLLERLEVAVDGGKGQGRTAVPTYGRGQAVGRSVVEDTDRIEDPHPLRGQPHTPSPQTLAKVSHNGEPTRRWRPSRIAQAISGYDKIIGLDLSEAAVDGSLHKAPCGGEGTVLNPTDRAKIGWKWSVATDLIGAPAGWVIDGANRHDSILLEPTLQAVADRGLLLDVETLHLDRGYDSNLTTQRCHSLGVTDIVCTKKKRKGEAKIKKPLTLGLRWPVERTNSWFSNFGQLRRNTDRFSRQRLGQVALAVALILTLKLVKWAKRWTD